jgi:Carboxypeptidase regulatory-like domain
MSKIKEHISPTSSGAKLHQLLCFLLLNSLLSLIAHGQVLYGSLTGTVTDASGAVVSGAGVTALEVRTGATQNATTDSSGIYRFATLLPGTYTVTITAPGFSRQETPDVR